MDAIKYSDAGHSVNLATRTSTETSSIEMDTLENPSDHHLQHHKHDSFHGSDPDSEDDSGDDDEGDRALLTPRERPHDWESPRSPGLKTRIWQQVQRIVIEVILLMCDMRSRY